MSRPMSLLNPCHMRNSQPPCSHRNRYYDLDADPWHLTNAAANISAADLAPLLARLETLRQCAGAGCA